MGHKNRSMNRIYYDQKSAKRNFKTLHTIVENCRDLGHTCRDNIKNLEISLQKADQMNSIYDFMHHTLEKIEAKDSLGIAKVYT